MLNMKDSGIEWVGEIPDEWMISKLKYCIKESNSGEIIPKEYWNEGSELLYSCNKEPIYSSYKNFNKSKRTKYRDILLTRNGTAYVHLPKINSIYTNVVQKITPTNQVNHRYLMYNLVLNSKYLVGNGDIIESFNMGYWNNCIVFKIPLEEQIKIADFLDKKCNVIDELTKDIQSQIEILENYKKSIITETVTKGLNSNVEMKDSEIESIGDIPKDWEVSKLKYNSQIYVGGTPSRNNLEFWENGNIPWIPSGKLKNNILTIQDVDEFITNKGLENSNTKEIKPNSVLVALTGSTIGSVAINTFSTTINQSISSINIDKKNNYKYYFYLLYSQYNQIVSYKEGGAQSGINKQIISNLYTIKPPLKEQKEIAKYLDNKCNEIDILITDKKKQLEVLEKYKQSIIYEYVTGKKEVI